MLILDENKPLKDVKEEELRMYSVCSTYKDNQKKEVCERAFREGFAFGYQKAKEEPSKLVWKNAYAKFLKNK